MPGMTLEEMRQFVRNHFEEFVNRNNIDIGDVNFAPEFVEEGVDVPPGLAPGPQGMPVTIEDLIAEGDKVVVAIPGPAPTHKPESRFAFPGS